MRTFFILAAFAALAYAENQMSACELCKSSVSSFVEASKNPMKMTQMKVSILEMCTGTSHQKDCEKTVAKMDLIVKKLAPFLGDSEAVCNHVQMCNSQPGKVSFFSNLALLFWKQAQARVESNLNEQVAICDKCQVLSQEAATFFTNKGNKQAAHFIAEKYVCSAAGKHSQLCSLVANTIIPSVFEEMGSLFADHSTICSDMKLCNTAAKPIAHPKKHGESLLEVFKKAGVYQFNHGEELMSCFECTLSADATLEELINTRQETADLIQKEVCGEFPEAWDEGCNDFFHMYLSTVLYLTYNQFDGKEVCEIADICPKSKSNLLISREDSRREGCNQCGHMEHFLATHSEQMHFHVASMINSAVCQKLPMTFHNVCDRVATNVSGKILTAINGLAVENKICKAAC